MLPHTCIHVQFVISISTVFLIVFLNQLLLAEAVEINIEEFNFVAAGDWGCGHEAIHTFSMMKSMEPELYLGLGDYSYENSMDCWIDIIKSAGNAFKISLGNHDIEGKLLQAYMDEFELEKQYYSFNYLNTHFIALSTELDKSDQVEQLEFVTNNLLKTASNPNIDWTIIFFHRPFYSASASDFASMTKTYHTIFEEFGVDLVLQGHSHNYQRTYPLLFNDKTNSKPIISDKEQSQYHDPKGVIFVVAGTGGESIQPLNKKSFLVSTYEGYGCLNVEINSNSMSVEYYSDSNESIDKFTITKEPQSNNPNVKTQLQKIEYQSTK
jgi:predicted phosphodiesterase